jgi:uncharacterized protein (TIGR03437 family)
VYLIVSVAGTGSFGFTGDGGSAVLAQLANLSSVAVGSSGTIYIADFCAGDCTGGGGSRIREISPDGIINTILGGTTCGPPQSCPPSEISGFPYGLAVDLSGNIFISDTGNQRILKLTPSGVVTMVAGNPNAAIGQGGTATSTAIGYPYGIAVDSSGNLFISASTNPSSTAGPGVIWKVASTGLISSFFAPVQTPSSVVADTAGNVYILDSGAILKVGPNGALLSSVSIDLNSFSSSNFAVDAAGNIFVSGTVTTGGTQSRVILRINQGSSSGTIVAGGGNDLQGDGGPATQFGFSSSASTWLSTDSQGDVYVAESPLVKKLIPTNSSASGCIYSMDTTSKSFNSTGGSLSVGILTSASGCPWLAVSYTDWIAVNPSGVGTGTGLVTITVAANSSSLARSGTAWIGGNALTISQAGVVCALSVAPRTVSVAPAGLTGSTVTVTANAPDCGWTAATNVPWILVSGGKTGAGSGTVTYTVGINTGASRTGAISVAGETVYVNQAAAGASISSLASISGIVNGASNAPPIAPSSFVTIYGENLADSVLDWSAASINGALPMSLGGVQVVVNGKNAFVSYVQPSQVNILTQPDTAAGPVEVDVITNHGTVSATANMALTSPALFTYALQTTVYASAFFATDYAYVAAVGAIPGVTSRPANPGDYILLYATGLGNTNPAYPVGQVLTTAYPIANPSQVSVLIGGQPAPVLFAGMVYAGVFQVNIQVPANVPAGDQAVILSIAGQPSQQNVFLTFGQ